ncbi:MAG: serine/threonine-protein kinase [Phycisphaerae bacterium]|nr:serine/threonine-protein kinase [Phycisphaerae bacterium]
MSLKKRVMFRTTFATYTATDIIGQGGYSRVFEAVDDSGEKWAVKLLDATRATQEQNKRFKNELTFCLRNKHRNIVTVVDHGVAVEGDKPSPFYVMPRYDGSLRNLLKSGIPRHKVLQYFAHLLDGVEAAHLQGVIHRDLKPENILYDAKADLLLIADFGIARFEEDELFTAVETKDSAKLANFQYAAPEQRGRGLKTDQRADIYALGLILNEMFTGQVPYGTGYRTIGPGAPDYAYLDDLVAQMLRQSPNDRFLSIEAIKGQLIGRQNEFVTRQRLSELQNTVIQVTETDDPLIVDPPRLVSFDWERGTVSLLLSRPVNALWIGVIQNMGSYSCLPGKGPRDFAFADREAAIRAREDEVQPIIDYFKGWLPQANQIYAYQVRQDRERREAAARQELQREVNEQEARQRVLKNAKI